MLFALLRDVFSLLNSNAKIAARRIDGTVFVDGLGRANGTAVKRIIHWSTLNKATEQLIDKTKPKVSDFNEAHAMIRSFVY